LGRTDTASALGRCKSLPTPTARQGKARQSVWYFLLVINSNLGRISHRFRDLASFPLKSGHFAYSPSIQHWICKCFPCTGSL